MPSSKGRMALVRGGGMSSVILNALYEANLNRSQHTFIAKKMPTEVGTVCDSF